MAKAKKVSWSEPKGFRSPEVLKRACNSKAANEILQEMIVEYLNNKETGVNFADDFIKSMYNDFVSTNCRTVHQMEVSPYVTQDGIYYERYNIPVYKWKDLFYVYWIPEDGEYYFFNSKDRAIQFTEKLWSDVMGSRE